MHNRQEYTVVKSVRSGIMQHDPFSWEIKEGGFIELEDVTKRSKLVDKTFSKWLSGLTSKERERFVEVFFKAIKPENETTLFDIENIKFKDIRSVIELAGSLEPEERKLLTDSIKDIVKLSLKVMKE